jgi:DNA repair protein RadC
MLQIIDSPDHIAQVCEVQVVYKTKSPVPLSERPILNTPKKYYEVMYSEIIQKELSLETAEVMYALLVDATLRPMFMIRLGQGTLNSTQVDIKALFRAIVMIPCTGVVLMHNHPSGSVTPSAQDDRLTKTIATACESVFVRLLDHLIVSPFDDDFYSYGNNQQL